MNEIPKILEANENVLWDGTPKYAPYIVAAIFSALLVAAVLSFFVWAFTKSTSIPLVVGPVLFLIGVIWSHLSYTVTHYAITNKRAIMQKGVIGRDFKSLDYDRIQNASADVDILGVIFKVGSVKMFTGEIAGGGGGKHGSSIRPVYDVFAYVPEPYEVLKVLQQNLSKRKEQLYGGKTA